MKDKVVVVSGGGRGLGLVQAEALIEAGAVGKLHAISVCGGFLLRDTPKPVHCIDILPDPSLDPTSEFAVVAARAKKELNSHLTYHRVDVTEEPQVSEVFEKVAAKEGRLDGCLVAAGINYESPALEYSPEQVDRMLRINVKGAFLTAQGAARIMVRFGTPGSICLIASMSGTIANRGMFAS
jgi:NAD(P)-dependent dehydrogenase (short-subunit alcohol dehydrogenase family)